MLVLQYISCHPKGKAGIPEADQLRLDHLLDGLLRQAQVRGEDVEPHRPLTVPKLLPQLGMFDCFDLYFAAPGVLGENILGRYLRGSWQRPTMFIDLHCCRQVATEKGLKRSFVIYTTILHELDHAVQEALGLPFDEDEAEEFAILYCESGSVWEFWKRI